MTDDEFLHPNQDGVADTRVSRRLLLAGTAAAGVTATAGCSSDAGDGTATGDDTATGTEEEEATTADTVYVFNTGDRTVSVVDVESDSVVGTWGPTHEKLHAPVQTENEVKAIGHASGSVTATVPVGSRPYDATAATVRPSESVLTGSGSASESLRRRLAGEGTTYCIGDCACGHEL